MNEALSFTHLWVPGEKLLEQARPCRSQALGLPRAGEGLETPCWLLLECGCCHCRNLATFPPNQKLYSFPFVITGSRCSSMVVIYLSGKVRPPLAWRPGWSQ